jgi:mannose-6-phosphate isomerase-like protein (cupin superfamily)
MSEFFVIKEPQPQPQDFMLKDILKRSAWLDDAVVKGAPYFDAAWVVKDIPKGPQVQLHHHNFDEYLGFMGGDGNNPMDLGCEVQIQVDDEVMTFHETFLVYIPAGTKHGIISMTNLKRPVLCYSGGPNVAYSSSED